MKTPELLDEICRRIADGETLRSICRDAHTPSWRTVYDWINDDPVFASRIERARELGFDAIAEEALTISDTPLEGTETEISDTGTKVKKSDMLGHRKLQIETRLKLLAKWHPKKYGDSSKVELSGSLALNQMSDDEIRAELAALTAAGIVAPPADDYSDLI
jgi:hypothetical protein